MKLAGLAALVAAVAGALVLAFQPFADGDTARSPLDVVGAFSYHLDRGNFGKACSLMAQKARGELEECSDGFLYNGGINMALYGLDIYENVHVVPHSQKENEDGSFTFKLVSDELPPVAVRVAKQDNGFYRIVRIG